MSDFPHSNGYGRPCDDAQHINIHGTWVPVGNGIHGNDLAKTAGPGRRPVLLANGQTKTLESSKFYNPDELRDKHGRPVKISSIPDRTKGMHMASERVLVFLDYANIAAGSRAFQELDYGALLEYLAEGRFLVDAYAYVPIDPRRPEARRFLVRSLQEDHWLVYQKMGKIAGDSYKSNVDVEMCIDIMRSAQEIRPDIIVLCSGDGDFLPVVRELRRMGIRAEVASFEKSADTALGYEASGFISLDVWRNGGAHISGLYDSYDVQEDFCEQSASLAQTSEMEDTPPDVSENGVTKGCSLPAERIPLADDGQGRLVVEPFGLPE